MLLAINTTDMLVNISGGSGVNCGVGDHISMHSNEIPEEAFTRIATKAALGSVLALLSFITFAGNVIVIHAVRINRKLQTVG